MRLSIPFMCDAGVPRADKCPSKERPEGHYAVPKGRTPLMQHLDFFDW